MTPNPSGCRQESRPTRPRTWLVRKRVNVPTLESTLPHSMSANLDRSGTSAPTKGEGHYTLWGDPDVLLSKVVGARKPDSMTIEGLTWYSKFGT